MEHVEQRVVDEAREVDVADVVADRRRFLRLALPRHGGQVVGGAEREEVDGHAGHDVVDADRHGHEGVDQAADGAGDDAEQDALPRAPLDRAVGPEPRAEDHHPLEADVHDAGPLGPEAAEAGERDRHGQQQGAVEHAVGGELGDAAEEAADRQDEDRGDQHGRVGEPAGQPAGRFGRRRLGAGGGRVGDEGGHAGAPANESSPPSGGGSAVVSSTWRRRFDASRRTLIRRTTS